MNASTALKTIMRRGGRSVHSRTGTVGAENVPDAEHRAEAHERRADRLDAAGERLRLRLHLEWARKTGLRKSPSMPALHV
jgi:hypothetical protein